MWVENRRGFKACVRPPQLPPPIFLGSLSNDNSDFNENGKNPIVLDWQNNNFVRASRFCLHFLAAVARLQRDSA